jgi:deoxyadenosine/deoxycytidine kinase
MKDKFYIAVEGPIGAGKTSLARLLAREVGYELLLEDVEANPFLADFYRDRERFAFPAQVFFLLSRYQQQRRLRQAELFAGGVVSDYLFAKDRIFANLTLEREEIALYGRLADLLQREAPRPDAVIYLQAGTETLLKRIAARGRAFEREIRPDYIADLNEAYNFFFFHYKAAPLLVVNTDHSDFVGQRRDFEELLRQLQDLGEGTRYLRFAPPR